jgi:hypothetical protein
MTFWLVWKNVSDTDCICIDILCWRPNFLLNKTKLTRKKKAGWESEWRAHQTRRSGRSSRPISAEIVLPWLQSEIKVALFLFASRSFLSNNLCFMVKVIDKAIVINVKIHKNERKRLYSSNKENLTCWEKSITANL